MVNTFLKISGTTAILLGLLFLWVPQQASATGGKVNFAFNDSNLTLGSSGTMVITLSEPIVCSDLSDCSVTLDLSSSVPAGMTLTPAIFTWDAASWYQIRATTVAIASDATALVGQTTTLAGILASNSEYYRNYNASFPVIVRGSTSTPTPDPELQLGLANTGTNKGLLDIQILSAIGLVLAGFALHGFARRKV